MPDPTPLNALRLIWVAMLTAVLVHTGLAWGIGPVAATDPELVRWLGIFAAVAAGIQVLVVFLLKQMIAGVSAGRYVTYCVVRWALIEAIAVYGLVLKILGGSWVWAGAFLVVSISLLATLPPSQSEQEEFLRDD